MMGRGLEGRWVGLVAIDLHSEPHFRISISIFNLILKICFFYKYTTPFPISTGIPIVGPLILCLKFQNGFSLHPDLLILDVFPFIFFLRM